LAADLTSPLVADKPQTQKLKEINLSYNIISNLTSLSLLSHPSSLLSLNLLSNNLCTVASLFPLSLLQNLTHLTLQRKDGTDSNPVCDVEGYVEAVLSVAPFLEVLDERSTSDYDEGFTAEYSPPRGVSPIRASSPIRDDVEDVSPMPKFEQMKRRVQDKEREVELKRIERIEEQMRLLGALAQEVRGTKKRRTYSNSNHHRILTAS
jgi:hypothetical protein